MAPLLHNVTAERAVLGSCLTGGLDVVATIRSALPADPFWSARHAMVWRVVCALADDGIAPDLVTVPARARQCGERWGADDDLAVADLFHDAPMLPNAAHATEVASWARIRAIWTAGTRITQRAAQVADLGADIDGTLDHLVEQVVLDLSEVNGGQRDQRAHSWRPVDIEPILAGTWTAPTPNVGRRADGRAVLYPGLVHTAAGESESGKTWFAAALAGAELDAGNAVIHLDFEDAAAGVVGRYLASGATREQLRNQFAYVRPYDPLTGPGARADLEAALTRLRPTLVIADGVTEAMTLHDLDPLSNADAAEFGAVLLRWIAQRGPAVLALDHVTKARDDRGRYALGAAHKLNAVDGAAFILANRRPFGIGITGRTTVLLAKDRPGQLRQHARPSSDGLWWFGDLVMHSHDETFVELEIAAPPVKQEEFRPTVLMSKVAQALRRASEPLTQRGITDRVGGKRVSEVRRAIAYLIDEGYVKAEPGKSRQLLHTLVKDFTIDGEQMELDDGKPDQPSPNIPEEP